MFLVDLSACVCLSVCNAVINSGRALTVSLLNAAHTVGLAAANQSWLMPQSSHRLRIVVKVVMDTDALSLKD